MVLGWLTRQRRRRLLRQPFPEAWLQILRTNVAHYHRLTPAEQAKLRGDVRIFVAEKNWEGCGGLRMTDEVQVTVAAQACLLVLGLPDEHFDSVRSILVYPDAYVAPHQSSTGGVVLEGSQSREGEAWYRGPVVLSWADALAGSRGARGRSNLVLHEFAHQLDMQNGRELDGTPPLDSRVKHQRWQQVISSEFERLRRDSEEGQATLLDDYGATNVAEFFAVATECFFEQPVELLHQHPELYGILRDYFRQHPAARAGIGG